MPTREHCRDLGDGRRTKLDVSRETLLAYSTNIDAPVSKGVALGLGLQPAAPTTDNDQEPATIQIAALSKIRALIGPRQMFRSLGG